MSDPRPARSPEKVRQGATGRPVLYVLVAALILALIAFAGMGLYGNALPDQNIPGAAVDSGVDTSPQTPAAPSSIVVQPTGTSTPDPAPAPAN